MNQDNPATNRLNKHLALELGISRREADNLIDDGHVHIGDVMATLGARFKDDDNIFVDHKLLGKNTKFQYIAFNKPINYVCSRRQQGDSPTIYDILPDEYRTLKPVGRLDRKSSGLILLTNDGDFAYQMTHPKFIKTKVYECEIDPALAALHQQMISDYGVTLEDGPSKLSLERMIEGDSKRWRVTMHEGRNRQIRRTFGSLGYDVVKLHRTNFGSYSLGDMKIGEYETVDMR
ncbi:MAG: pseudouridine synthase [Candidatus Saccharimonadales bacterium]